MRQLLVYAVRLSVLRSWDVFVASSPLLACLLLGTVIWRKLSERFLSLSSSSLGGVLLAGAATIQALTWAGALFSERLVFAVQALVTLAGAIALLMLVLTQATGRFGSWIPGGAVPRVAAAVSFVAGFLLAGSYVPDSVPSDAIAYHIPISAWFGRGNAWAHLPDHTWNAQWPLASSLWSSFVMGHIPVTDRLVGWSAQNYAFLVWTAAVAFSAIRKWQRPGSRGDLVAASGLCVSLLLGAYSGFQSVGFVDYRLGLLLCALASVLIELPVSWRTVPIAVALASCTAEFRPQGLLVTMTIGVVWIGFHAGFSGEDAQNSSSPARVPVTNFTKVKMAVLALLATALAAKWWILTWARWGTPAPPMFARWWNLRETEKFADELFHYLWESDVVRGLKLLVFGTRETLPLTIVIWVLVILVAPSMLTVLRRENTFRRRAREFLGRGAVTAPIAMYAYVATQVPSEAPRMIMPIVPALLILDIAIAIRLRHGFRFADWKVAGFVWVFVGASLATAAPPWRRPHAGKSYPSPTTIYFSHIESQLSALSGERPLIFDQYIAFLPAGFRQMGVTYGPWATFPKEPLRTRNAWKRWFDENDVRTLVVQEGKRLENTWEWTQDRTTTPDFRVLDLWITGCRGRRTVGQWVVCPVDRSLGQAAVSHGRPGPRSCEGRN